MRESQRKGREKEEKRGEMDTDRERKSGKTDRKRDPNRETVMGKERRE